MSTDILHRVIARCLTDPKFLAEMTRDREAAVNHLDLDAESRLEVLQLDFDRIEKFCGFITKVRYNPLRAELPQSFKLLSFLREEVSFFTMHFESFMILRQEGMLTPQQRAHSFRNGLIQYLERAKPPYMDIVREVVTHESILWDLREIAHHRARTNEVVAKHQTGHTLEQRPSPTTIPRLRGHFQSASYYVDVRAAISGLRAGTFDPAQVPALNHMLGYWLDSAGPIQLFEIDPLTALLFSKADGHSTVSEIAIHLREKGSISTSDDILAAYADAADQGLVEFHH